jgi:ABC-type glycerol-3-phosphate transport system permease component
MVVTAFKEPGDIIGTASAGGMRLLPDPPTTENFRDVLGKVEEFPVWRWTFNSVFHLAVGHAACARD